jgi:ribosomal protein S18 acetylase RimI-like enzyme
MSWVVWHTNESAIRFYEHMGAQSVDTVRLMRLDLGEGKMGRTP